MKMSHRRARWPIALGILFIVALGAGGWWLYENRQKAPNPASLPQPTQPDQTKTNTEKAREYVAKMTLAQKVGQMFYVDLNSLRSGTNFGADPTAIDDAQIENLKQYAPGGVIYFGGNLVDRAQLIQYNQDLQGNSATPLFIGTDEEGGDVRRLGGRSDFGVTAEPAAAALDGDSNRAKQIGAQLAQEMTPLGFNQNFAPVAGVATANGSALGARIFSANPQVTAGMVSAEVQGLQDNGLSATVKHFPGLGGATGNTETGDAVNYASLSDLKQTNFPPFQAGINAGTDFVMVGHLLTPNARDDNLPASLSKIAVTDWLRGDLKFQKIVITDSLQMGAITQNYSTDQVVQDAVGAGVDMLLMPENWPEAYATLLNLVQTGQVPESRIDESVTRIIEVKIARGLIQVDE